MNIGTTCTDNLDGAYFGMFRNPGNDKTDAVVAWADNNGGDAGPDNLRFIFLAGLNPAYGQAGTREGLEVGRFSPDGNFGVGNFFNPAIQPLRRMEALDMGRNLPQLRLTHTQNANVSLGINTDFQTTSARHLYIHPSNEGVNQFVGINDDTPSNTLEITSTSGVSPQPAGLRFTNLTSASAPDAGIAFKFLTVNASGDVILDDAPTAPTNFVIPCSTLTTNYLTKATGANTICNTVVHEAGNHDIGIGVQNTSGARLQVLADNGFSPGVVNDNAGGISVINNQHANSTNTNVRSIYSGDLTTALTNIPVNGVGLALNVNTVSTGVAYGINNYTTAAGNNAIGYFNEVTGNGDKSVGIFTSVNSNGGTSADCYGIEVQTMSSNSDNNIASHFKALDANTTNIATECIVQASNSTSTIYGLKSYALRPGTYSGTTYGVYTNATAGSGNPVCYGIYADLSSSNAASYAIWANGAAGGTSLWTLSDSISKRM